MEIHFLVNYTMDPLANRHFLPSLPPDFRPFPHRSEVATSGEFGKDGYYAVLVDKIEWILSVIEGALDGQLMFWSDVDVIFNPRYAGEPGILANEIRDLASGKDLLFQRECAGGADCNTGIQIIRRNTRTLIFYAQVRLMLHGYDGNDQTSVNRLLSLVDGLEWGQLPLLYSNVTNGGLSAESRLYHANGTVMNSMACKQRLLEDAGKLWASLIPVSGCGARKQSGENSISVSGVGRHDAASPTLKRA